MKKEIGIVITADAKEIDGEISLVATVQTRDGLCVDKPCGDNYFGSGDIVIVSDESIEPASNLLEKEQLQLSIICNDLYFKRQRLENQINALASKRSSRLNPYLMDLYEELDLITRVLSISKAAQIKSLLSVRR